MPETKVDILLQLKQNLDESLKKANGALKGTTAGTKKVAIGLKDVEQGLDKIGRKASLAFVALGGAVLGATKAFADLEKGIVNVETLLDTKELEKYGSTITNQVTKAVSKLGFTIQDSNKAMFDTVSALGANDVAFATYEEAQKLAIGGATDLGIAVDGMTSIINAYGKETTKASDVSVAFFAAQKRGKTTVADLASNIGKLAPIARQAGIGFKTLLASVAQLTLGGISTEESVTALRGAISGLIKPAEGAAQKLRDLGLPVGATEVQALGFTKTLEKLAEVAREDKDALSEMIPNIRALTAFSALGTKEVGNLKKIISEMTAEELKAASGTDVLTNAFDKNMATVDRAFKVMTGSLKIAAASLGEVFAPTITKITVLLKNFATTITNLSPETKKLIANIVLFATATAGLVAALTLVGGQVIGAILVFQKLKAIIQGVAIAQKLLNLAFLVSPIGLIITGIIVAVGLLYIAWKHDFLGMQKMVEELGSAFGIVFDFIKERLVEAREAIKKYASTFVKAFKFINENTKGLQKTIGGFSKSLIKDLLGIGKAVDDISKDKKAKIEIEVVSPIDKLKEYADKAKELLAKQKEAQDQYNQQMLLAEQEMLNERQLLLVGSNAELGLIAAANTQLELERLKSQFDKEKELELAKFNLKKSILKDTGKLTKKEQDKLRKELQDINIKYNALEEQTEKKKLAMKASLRQIDFQGIKDILSMAVKENTAAAYALKAIRIGEVVVNTAKSVSMALASSPPPISWINAGISAAKGAAQVAIINGVSFAQGGMVPEIPKGDTGFTTSINESELVVPKRFSDLIAEGTLSLVGGGAENTATTEAVTQIIVNLDGASFFGSFTDEIIRDIGEKIGDAIDTRKIAPFPTGA